MYLKGFGEVVPELIKYSSEKLIHILRNIIKCAVYEDVLPTERTEAYITSISKIGSGHYVAITEESALYPR